MIFFHCRKINISTYLFFQINFYFDDWNISQLSFSQSFKIDLLAIGFYFDRSYHCSFFDFFLLIDERKIGHRSWCVVYNKPKFDIIIRWLDWKFGLNEVKIKWVILQKFKFNISVQNIRKSQLFLFEAQAINS